MIQQGICNREHDEIKLLTPTNQLPKYRHWPGDKPVYIAITNRPTFKITTHQTIQEVID